MGLGNEDLMKDEKLFGYKLGNLQKSILIYLYCKCPIIYKGQGKIDLKELDFKIRLKTGTKNAIWVN